MELMANVVQGLLLLAPDQHQTSSANLASQRCTSEGHQQRYLVSNPVSIDGEVMYRDNHQYPVGRQSVASSAISQIVERQLQCENGPQYPLPSSRINSYEARPNQPGTSVDSP